MAVDWLARFEGAGLDGVIAKPQDGTYQPGKRAMIKVKHARTADCVVAGFRWHKNGKNTLIGSLLLGLLRRQGHAASRRRHVGVHDGDAQAARAGARSRCATNALEKHPWREWADADAGNGTRMPGGQSRWSAGKDLSWEPLRDRARVRGESTTTCRATASGTRRSSCGGGPTSSRATAATISSRSRRPYELEKVFGT